MRHHHPRRHDDLLAATHNRDDRAGQERWTMA
jgi:hypothetical protein